jgi:cell division septation protein DedD
MDESLKHRILGASIFVIFLSFIVPLVLDGNDQNDYLERTLVESDQIENSSRRVVEIYLDGKEFELNSQSSKNLNFFSQIKSRFNMIAQETVTDETDNKINESANENREMKGKEIQASIENEFWTVQLGSYRDLNNAKGEIVSLRDLNFNAYIKEDKAGDVSEYKVRVGSELTKNMAEEISSNLKMNNYENQLVPYN